MPCLLVGFIVTMLAAARGCHSTVHHSTLKHLPWLVSVLRSSILIGFLRISQTKYLVLRSSCTSRVLPLCIALHRFRVLQIPAWGCSHSSESSSACHWHPHQVIDWYWGLLVLSSMFLNLCNTVLNLKTSSQDASGHASKTWVSCESPG